jgi:hypothetical protein
VSSCSTSPGARPLPSSQSMRRPNFLLQKLAAESLKRMSMTTRRSWVQHAHMATYAQAVCAYTNACVSDALWIQARPEAAWQGLAEAVWHVPLTAALTANYNVSRVSTWPDGAHIRRGLQGSHMLVYSHDAMAASGTDPS